MVHAHAIVTRYARLDAGVVVHPGAVIGGDPQDLRFDPATSSTARIGPRTILRENVTVNRSTVAGGETLVGADCFLMTGAHVAHDCVVGDKVVLANNVMLAGHVRIGAFAFVGGGAGFHQFTRVGESAMVGGLARISLDIPPYVMAAERDEVVGLNLVGLKRRGLLTRGGGGAEGLFPGGLFRRWQRPAPGAGGAGSGSAESGSERVPGVLRRRAARDCARATGLVDGT